MFHQKKAQSDGTCMIRWHHPSQISSYTPPKKGLFQGNTSSNHWFSGDMLVFQGVGTRSVHFNQWLVPFGSLCNEGLRLAMYHIRLIPNPWEGNGSRRNLRLDSTFGRGFPRFSFQKNLWKGGCNFGVLFAYVVFLFFFQGGADRSDSDI